MKIIKIIAIISSSIFLTSCDPIHEIVFENTGKKDAKVKLIIDKKNYYLNQISVGDSIVFNLKPVGKIDSNANIYFGIGSWDETEISELTKSIKSIEIDNIDKKVIYKSENSIKEFLIDNQKGFLNTQIKIETK